MVPMKWLSAALLALGSLAAIAETAPPASTAPLTPAAAPAENNTVAAKPAEGPTAHALTADDVNAWLDGYMPYALATGDLAGAVVAVVKDGQILTERGFGYANVEKKTPVDPKLKTGRASCRERV